MNEENNWDKEYDVVVVGCGGAGISTAITAHDNGADVIVLEKAPFLAGSQTLSSGIGAAFATNPEKAAEFLYAVSSNGLEDADPESKVSVVPKEDCLIFMKEMDNNPDWLASMGVKHAVRMGSSVMYPNFPGADSFGHIVVKGRGTQFLESMQ